MATARGGKPYLWVTWLAKILGGDQCLWSLWFKGRFKYQKFEQNAEQLADWNRDHNRLMRDRRQELEEAGYVVAVEEQNAFKVEGTAAVVAGKPDIIATRQTECQRCNIGVADCPERFREAQASRPSSLAAGF
jgi:hypothetical protein